MEGCVINVFFLRRKEECVTNCDSHVAFYFIWYSRYLYLVRDLSRIFKVDITNLPGKMSSNRETKQTGKTVLIPVDGSENSERAFQCKYFHLPCVNNGVFQTWVAQHMV